MNMTIEDHLTNEKKDFNFPASKSTSIKKRLFGKGLTKRTFGMSYSQLHNLMLTKSAGKIRWFFIKAK
jgi:hypothetical protein